MPGRQIHLASDCPRERACRRVEIRDDACEDAARLRVVEAVEDDPGVDASKAIQEECDPDAEGPPADEVEVAWGLIVT